MKWRNSGSFSPRNVKLTTPLWDAVQAQLKANAPPRKRKTNDRQGALLKGLLIDPHGRVMVPTYGSNKVKRYAYYETRKDLARPDDPPSLRFQRGQLEQHLIAQLTELLNDQHRLRRLSGLEDAGALRTLFTTADLLSLKLAVRSEVEGAVRSLIKEVRFGVDAIALELDPRAVGIEAADLLRCTIPLPHRKPFRETRLRIDAEDQAANPQNDLIALLSEALVALKLVQANPELNLNQLAKREGRCRTQLARLLRLSFLSPKVVDAIADGSQPKGLTRRVLLSCDVPIDWADQERQFGLVA